MKLASTLSIQQAKLSTKGSWLSQESLPISWMSCLARIQSYKTSWSQSLSGLTFSRTLSLASTPSRPSPWVLTLDTETREAPRVMTCWTSWQDSTTVALVLVQVSQTKSLWAVHLTRSRRTTTMKRRRKKMTMTLTTESRRMTTPNTTRISSPVTKMTTRRTRKRTGTRTCTSVTRLEQARAGTREIRLTHSIKMTKRRKTTSSTDLSAQGTTKMMTTTTEMTIRTTETTMEIIRMNFTDTSQTVMTRLRSPGSPTRLMRELFRCQT